MVREIGCVEPCTSQKELSHMEAIDGPKDSQHELPRGNRLFSFVGTSSRDMLQTARDA
jgi:hypothetical protein